MAETGEKREDVRLCEKCGTPKECVVGGKLFPILCKCERELRSKTEEEKLENERKRSAENVRRENVPEAYRAFTFSADDGKTPEELRVCKRYAERFGELGAKGYGLLFFGNVGTGKTYYASCIANRLIDEGYRVGFLNMTEAAHLPFTDKLWLQKLVTSDAVVIDDLGAERGGAYAQEQAYRVVDGCCARGVPMLVTTNLKSSGLKANAGSGDVALARVYSRILERCYPVCVNAEPRRAERAQRMRKEMAEALK